MCFNKSNAQQLVNELEMIINTRPNDSWKY